jgi:hypothetical protein
MAMFITKLRTEKIDKRLWRLLSQLVFRSDDQDFIDLVTTSGLLISGNPVVKKDGRFVILRVPRGFCSDGASSPPFAWSLCPPMGGNHAEPSVLHDYLYKEVPEIARIYKDQIFELAMRVNGVGLAKRKLMVWAVIGYQTTAELLGKGDNR